MAEEFDKEFDELDKMLAEDPMGELPNDDGAIDGVMRISMQDAIKQSVAVDKVAESMTKGILSGLPNDTGEAISEAYDIGSEVLDHVSEGLETVKKATSGLLGSIANILPETLASPINRIREWLGGEDETPGGQKEPSEDEKIKQEVAGLFGEVIDAQAKLQEVAAKESQLAQLGQQELLSKIATTNQELLGLRLKYDIVYQRKDLELSLKRTILLTKIYDVMTKFSDLSTKQLEAIVKNTALPDFAKYNSLTYLKESVTKKLLDKTGSLFINNNFVSSITKRLKDMVTSKVQDVVSGMDMPKSMLDMLSEQKDMIPPEVLLTDMLLSGVRDKVAQKTMEPFVQGLLKSESGIETYKKIEELRSDPSKFFKELAKQQDTEKITGEVKEKIFDFLSEILKPYEQTETIQLFDKSELEKGAMFDNKTKTAIVKVIPTLLSKILQEVRAIRKGRKEVSDKDLEHFDYDRNKFITRRELKEETIRKIKDEAKSLGRTFNDNILEYLVGDRVKKLTDKQKTELFLKFNDYVMSGNSLSPFVMYKEFLPMLEDEKLRDYVKKTLNVMVNNKENIKEGKHIRAQKEFEYYKYNKLSNFKDTAIRLSNLGAEDLIEEFGLGDATALSTTRVMEFNKKYGRLGLKKLIGEEQELKATETKRPKTEQQKQLIKPIKEEVKKPLDENKTAKTILTTDQCCKDNISAIKTTGESIVKSIIESSKNIIDSLRNKLKIPQQSTGIKIEQSGSSTTEIPNPRQLITNVRLLETKLNVPYEIRRQSMKDLNKIFTIRDDYVKGIYFRSYAESIATSTVKDKLSVIAEFAKSLDEKVAAILKLLSSKFKLRLKDEDKLFKPEDTTNVLSLSKEESKVLDTEVIEEDKDKKKETDEEKNIIDSVIEKFENIDLKELKNKASETVNKFLKSEKDQVEQKAAEQKSPDLLTSTKNIVNEVKDKFKEVIEPTTKPNRDYILGGLTSYNIIEANKKKELSPVTAGLNIDASSLGVDKIRNEVVGMVNDITTTFSSVRIEVMKSLSEFRKSIPAMWSDMKSDLENTFKDIKESITQFYKESIEPVMKDVGKSISETLETQYKEFKLKLSEENKQRLEKVEKYIEESKQDIKEVVDTVTNKFKTYKESPEEIKKDLVDIKENMKQQAQQAKETFKDVISDPNKAKEIFDLKINDIKEFVKDKLGEDKTKEIEEVLNKLQNNIPTSTEEVEKVMKDIKKSIPKDKKDLIKKVNKIERTIKSKIKKGIKFFNVSPKKVEKTIETMLNKIEEYTPLEITDDTKQKVKSTTSTTVKKVKHLSKDIINKVSKALTGVDEIDVEFLRFTQHIEELINDKGARAVLKKELINIPLPITYNEAVTVYRGLFNTLDPTGETWKTLYENDPKLVDKLRELHMEVIENARKGLIEKGLDAVDTGVDKTVTGISKMRDMLLSKLPEPIRKRVEPLLKNRFTNLAGNLTKRTTKAGIASAKLFKDEMAILGREGIQLFIDPKTGRLHIPRLTDLIRFTGRSYIHTTKALSKSLKVLYPELFGAVKDVGKTALKTAWEFSGIGRAMNRAKILAKARLNPPVDRDLYKLWLKGELTGKQVLDMLETDEEKERWENFLRAIAPRGITLADILLKTGKAYYKTTMGLSKGLRYTYPRLFKGIYKVSKAFAKTAWTLSGFSSLGKRALARIKPPIDKKLYDAWRKGELTTSEVMEMLPDYKKDVWANYIRSITPYGIPLPDVMYKTGKDIFNLVFDKPKESIKEKFKNVIYALTKTPSKIKEKMSKITTGIKDFLDRKTFGTVPLKFIRKEEDIEIIGDLFKETLPPEYKGIKRDEIIEMLAEKIHSRKALRIIKNNLREIESLIPDLNKPDVRKTIEDKLYEIADALLMDKHKEDKRRAKKEVVIKEREAIIRKYTSSEEEIKPEETKEGKIQQLKKDTKVVKFLDLFLNSYLEDQLDYLAYRAKAKNFDPEILDKLNNKLDKRYKRLIKAIKNYTELFVGYKNEVHEDNLAVESAADELIGLLAKIKISKQQEPEQILEDVKSRYKGKTLEEIEKEQSLKHKTVEETAKDMKSKITEPPKKEKTTKEVKEEPKVKKVIEDNVIGKEKEYTGMRTAFITTGTKSKTVEPEHEEMSVDEFENIFKRMADILNMNLTSSLDKATDKFVKTFKEELKNVEEEDNKTEEKQTKITEELKEQELKQTSVLEKMTKILEEIKSGTVKKFSPFDKDKDGDRDGNWKDRLAKLYGKTKDKAKTLIKKVKDKSKGNSLLSTLLKFLPLLIAGFKPLVKLAGKLILEGIKKLGGWILKGIKGLLGSIGGKIVDGIKSIGGFLGTKLKNLFHWGASKTANVGRNLINKVKPTKTLPTPKKESIFSKAFNWIKDKAVAVKNKITSGVSKLLKNSRIKAIATKIKNFIPKLKKVAVKKLGKAGAAKVLGKIASKLVPGVGLALLAWDAVNVIRYLASGMSFPSAVSKALIGIDLFSSDDDKKQEKTDDDKVKEPNLKKVTDKTTGKEIKLTVKQIFNKYGLDPDKGINWKDLDTKIKLDLAKAIINDKDHIYYVNSEGVMYRLDNPKNKPIDIKNIKNPELKQFAKSVNALISKKEKTEEEKQLLDELLNKDKFKNLSKAKSLELIMKRIELEKEVLNKGIEIYAKKLEDKNNKITHTKLSSKERELVNKLNKQDNQVNPTKHSDTKNTIRQQTKSNMLSKVHVTVNDKSEKYLKELTSVASRSVNEQALTNKNLSKLIELNQELVKLIGKDNNDENHNKQHNRHSGNKHNGPHEEEAPHAPVNLKSKHI